MASVLRSHRGCGPDARRLKPLGFSFAFVGLGMLPFRSWLFRRGWIRSEESGGPPLFAPFLKVKGDTGHIKTPGLPPDHHIRDQLNARGVLKVRYALKSCPRLATHISRT